MRGKKAKAIRRAIYGDYSHKAREYKGGNGWTGFDRDADPRRNSGLRRKYQQAKKQAKKQA